MLRKLRGSDSSDFTNLETLKFKNPPFQHILMYYFSLADSYKHISIDIMMNWTCPQRLVVVTAITAGMVISILSQVTDCLSGVLK